MQQFNLTEEDTSITRADIEKMLEDIPEGIPADDWIRRQLNGKLDEEAIAGVIGDLHTY